MQCKVNRMGLCLSKESSKILADGADVLQPGQKKLLGNLLQRGLSESLKTQITGITHISQSLHSGYGTGTSTASA